MKDCLAVIPEEKVTAFFPLGLSRRETERLHVGKAVVGSEPGALTRPHLSG